MNEILWAPTTQEPTGFHNDLKQKIKLNEKGKASEAAPQAIQIFVFASHNSGSLGTKKPTETNPLSLRLFLHYRQSFAACLHAATKLEKMMDGRYWSRYCRNNAQPMQKV